MNKKSLLLLVLPALLLINTQTVKAQGGVNAVMNIIETLQFLKDMKENKSKIEATTRSFKSSNKNESEPNYILMKDKYAVAKLAGDNILNTLVIDFMDRDKRKMFKDRPSLLADYYNEDVQVYNRAVADFNATYSKVTGKDAGFFSDIVKMILGDLFEATRRIAIEILVEKLKAPYSMKSWSEI